MDKALFAEICIRICNYITFVTFIGNVIFLPFIIRDTLRVKAICHQNFWISLILLHFSFWCFIISSILTNVEIFFTSNPNGSIKHSMPIFFYAKYLAVSSAGFLLGSLFQMFFERLLATYFYKTYEGSKKLWFIIIATILTLLFGVFNGYIWTAGINFFVNSAIFFTLDVIAAFLILILFKLNQRLRRLKNSSNIVLTHRYQIFENLRMLRHVFPLVICGSVGLIVGGTTTISISLFFPWMGNYIYITGNYYYSIGNFAAFIAYSHMILRPPSRREAILCFLKRFLCLGFSKVNPEENSTPRKFFRPRKNAMGDYVVNKHENKNDEGDTYFNMLKHDW